MGIRVRALSALVAAVALSATGARADTAVLGLAFDFENDGYGPLAEYHWEGRLADRPDYQVGWAIAIQFDDDDDAWIGAGVSGTYRLSPGTFAEGSLLAGFYNEGDLDLGGDIQFRTTLGLGVDLSERNAVSLGVGHLSNAGLNNVNPGTNFLMLRWRHRF